jgi:hypothetical protein
MTSDELVQLLTEKLLERATANEWRPHAIQFAATEIAKATEQVGMASESEFEYLIEFLPGSNVPQNCGHLYTLYGWLRKPVYANMNGCTIRVEGNEA